MAYFIEMGFANKAALCEGFRRTCHHGKATDSRKAPESALCVAGIHLKVPSDVGWAHSPCFGSVPDPHCKQCHAEVCVWPSYFRNVLSLCLSCDTRWSILPTTSSQKVTVTTLKSHEHKINFHGGKHTIRGKLPSACSIKTNECMHSFPCKHHCPSH